MTKKSTEKGGESLLDQMRKQIEESAKEKGIDLHIDPISFHYGFQAANTLVQEFFSQALLRNTSTDRDTKA